MTGIMPVLTRHGQAPWTLLIMGKHYLATRKPQRIARIKKKYAEMMEDRVPLARLDYDNTYLGHTSMPVSTLMRRLDDLGYTVLKKLESLLDEIKENYAASKHEAIAAIAYAAGQRQITPQQVLLMASGIAPAGSTGYTGIREEDALTKYDSEAPFQILRKPLRGSTLGHFWDRLTILSLNELQLLTERLLAQTESGPPSAPTIIHVVTDRMQ